MSKRKNMVPAQLRNLKQFKNKPVEEIQEVIKGQQFEFQEQERVDAYLNHMSEKYDLTELMPNDEHALEDLAKISVDIEDNEKRYREKLGSENVDWYELERIQNILKTLRSDRAKIEFDLGITRKNRQAAEDASPVTAIEEWKQRAKKMLQERLNYVYCPDCSMLLATVWFLNPTSGNSLTLTCTRETCGKKFTVTGSELIAKKNRNREDMLET